MTNRRERAADAGILREAIARSTAASIPCPQKQKPGRHATGVPLWVLTMTYIGSGRARGTPVPHLTCSIYDSPHKGRG